MAKEAGGVTRIRKGHDLKIGGRPEKIVEQANFTGLAVVTPADFKGITPKLSVREGDSVLAGTPLFFSKRHPGMQFCAPVSGCVESITYGERRSLAAIRIAPDHKDDFRPFPVYSADTLGNLSPDEIGENLLRSGLWPVIRQRPFSTVADPERRPKALFIPAMPTAPFAPDIQFQLEGRGGDFQAGVRLLKTLCCAAVHLVVEEKNTGEIFTAARDARLHRFSGPHPAGNVGIHIHHIAPIRHRNDIVWYVLPQDVARIGKLFLTGRLPVSKIIALGGEAVSRRCYLKIRQGMTLQDALEGASLSEPCRIISGDVLTGSCRSVGEGIGFYDEVVSVIPEKKGRDFMGWLSPGLRKYSVTNLFLSRFTGNEGSRLDTAMNGSTRVMVPFGNIESVLPMDLVSTWLIKMIIARDIDEMEKLGIYECDPEDFALCSFVDASKMEIAEIIRDGLEYIEKNG